MAADRLGEMVQDAYRIERALGQEELGTVYLAHGLRQRDKDRFALLVLNQRLDPFHAGFRAVLHDLQQARPLRDLGLVIIESATLQDGTPAFASEIVREHQRLRYYLQGGPLEVERALAIVLGLARALAAAHQAGVIHGDLRPDNVLLTDAQTRSVYAGRAALTWHSLYRLRACITVDSPADRLMYRPGNQLLGEGQPADASTDVFALGAILYECLAGRPAFAGERPGPDFVLEKLAGPPPALPVQPDTGLLQDVARALDGVVQAACAPNPGRRMGAMGDMVKALEEVAQAIGMPLEERLAGLPRRLPRGMTMFGWASPLPGAGAPPANETSAAAPEVPAPPPPAETPVDAAPAEVPAGPPKTFILPGRSIHDRPTQLRGTMTARAETTPTAPAGPAPVDTQPVPGPQPSPRPLSPAAWVALGVIIGLLMAGLLLLVSHG